MLSVNPVVARSVAGVRPRPVVYILALLALVSAAAQPARALSPESRVVTIDASTTLPVRTGIFAPTSTGDIIVLAEGALRGPTMNERFETGWFGPAGQDHFEGNGQPIVDGMPYGALIGGFTDDPLFFQFMGRMGAFSLQPGNVGEEFRLNLNMSAADLATLEGEVTVTIIYLPDGSADVSKFVIRDTTPLPLLTGMISEAGDQFVVLPRGRLRDPLLANSAYSDGQFGPEGLLGLVGAAQPFVDGPYGALYGRADPVGSTFYIGDGGCWTAQPSDVGAELQLTLNTDAASQAGLAGKFVIYVARVPAPDPTGVEPIDDRADARSTASPNPVREGTAIRFRLDTEDQVRLRVYDAAGRNVRLLADARLAAGPHAVAWDGRNEAGVRVPAGTYFYQLSLQSGSETGRLVVLD